MSRGVSEKITFNPYSQKEMWLLPPNDYLEEKEITGVIKYSTYEKETKRSFKKKTFNFENWNYDSEQKKYTCPAGNPVPYKKL